MKTHQSTLSQIPQSAPDRQRIFKWTRRVVLFFLYGFTYVVWIINIEGLVGTSLTPASIAQASQAMVQFDSFITAGWTAGFFYFWGSVTGERNALEEKYRSSLQGISSSIRLIERGVKDLGSVIHSVPGKVPEGLLKEQEDLEKWVQSQKEWVKERSKTMENNFPKMDDKIKSLLYYGVGTFGTFVVGAILAIIGILSPNGYTILSSFAFLFFGIALTIFEWSNLHAFGTRLASARIYASSITEENALLDRLVAEIRERIEYERRDLSKSYTESTSEPKTEDKGD